jgi:hypothetical protein
MEVALEKCLELFTEEQLRELRYADVSRRILTYPDVS